MFFISKLTLYHSFEGVGIVIFFLEDIWEYVTGHVYIHILTDHGRLYVFFIVTVALTLHEALHVIQVPLRK